MRATIVLISFVLLVAAPAAGAATATTADGNLHYQAAPGEVNNVTFTRVSGDTFRVTDLGAKISAGTGCQQESPNVVTCTTAAGKPIIANLNDQDDRASSRTSRSVQLFGEDGNDHLVGASGRDRIDGGNGDDSLSGGSGRDTISGGAGNDLLMGGTGNDSESGGSGDDVLREDSAPNGSDSLSGGSGIDTVDYSARSAPVDVSLDDRANDGDRHGNERDNVHSAIDRVLGGSGSDILIGRNGPSDALIGGAGDDLIDPLRGNDSVDGGPGIDQIRVRDLSSDQVICGDGVDSVAADALDAVSTDCEKVRRAVAMSVALAARAAYPTVMLRVTCPPSAFKSCAGRVLIHSLAKVVRHGNRHRTLTLGVRRFSVAVGQEAVIGLRIRAGARRYLGSSGLVVRAVLSAFDGAGPARKDAARFRVAPG